MSQPSPVVTSCSSQKKKVLDTSGHNELPPQGEELRSRAAAPAPERSQTITCPSGVDFCCTSSAVEKKQICLQQLALPHRINQKITKKSLNVLHSERTSLKCNSFNYFSMN